jgi:hypothetical protein
MIFPSEMKVSVTDASQSEGVNWQGKLKQKGVKLGLGVREGQNRSYESILPIYKSSMKNVHTCWGKLNKHTAWKY